ncbi:MAG: hypothetical protein COA47_03075 [Robiginitomaculum sp.]|nr:MAG: hypothetical protein COA47_03075 [Robiginitomaculum sp.]
MQAKPKNKSTNPSEEAHRNSKRILLTIGVSFAGKLFGFLRIQQTAALLGASYYADALVLSFQVLWLVEIVLISSAVVPSLVVHFYKQETEKGEYAATVLFAHVTLISCIIATVYGLVILFYAKQIAVMIAPGLHPQSIQLFQELMLTGAAIPLALAISHFASLLNRLFDNGIWYSIPQIITNLAGLTGLLTGYYFFGLTGAALAMIVGLLVSAIIMILVQLYVLPTHVRARFFSNIKQYFPEVFSFSGRKTFWAAVMALVGTAFIQEAYIYVDMAFASMARAEGGVGILGYASRLATLTNMLVVASAFVILEPIWARSFAARGSVAVHDTIATDVLSILCILSIPSALLIFYGEMIASIVYGGKNWNPEDLKLLGKLVSAYGGAVVGFGLSLMLARILNILGFPFWIAVVNGICLPIKIIISYFMVARYGLVGLALSTTFIVFLQSTGYSIVALRTGGRQLFQLSNLSALMVFYASIFLATWAASQWVPQSLVSVVLVACGLSTWGIFIGWLLKLSFVSSLFNMLSNLNFESNISSKNKTKNGNDSDN